MNSVVWIGQIVMALAFGAAGFAHSIGYERSKTQMVWMAALPPNLVRTIGALEIAGALGLILPTATGILPWLAPLAGGLLALVMLLAIGFHIRRREYPNIAFNAILGVLVLVVAIGRLSVGV